MQDIEREVELCEDLIRRGYPKKKIFESINSNFDKEEIFEIAKCRFEMGKKFSNRKLYFDKESLRYSTPEIIARYRANRIKKYSVADLSCGAGIQAIFFSFTNRKVLGVDINPKRVRYARYNAMAYDAKNIEFVVGNSLSRDIFKIASKYDVIFSDPARKPKEDERRLETLMPPPPRIMEIYGDKNYVFDLPPQISMEKIPADWEKEYISLNGKIKRLTTYSDELRECDRRAVSLPSGEEILAQDRDDGRYFTLSNELSYYLYIVDESLYYSSLLGKLEERYGINYLATGKRRTLATGEKLIESSFLKGFEVVMKSASIEEVIRELRREGVGKVTLRIDIDPGDYWKIRKRIESKLKGDKKGSLFRIGDYWVGARNVT